MRLSPSPSSGAEIVRAHSRIIAQSRLIPILHKCRFSNEAQNRRNSSRLNAISRKNKTNQDKIKIPDGAPLKESLTESPVSSDTEQTASITETPQAETPSSASAATPSRVETLSADEIRLQMSQIRAANAEAKAKEGFVEGVLEEVQLIQWPTPGSALLNTLLVLAIVGGTSLVLFAVNTTLAELSREVYKSL